MLKVGDCVTIANRDETKTYPFGFVDAMAKLSGQSFVIGQIDRLAYIPSHYQDFAEESLDCCLYRLRNDKANWAWSNVMFKECFTDYWED